MSGGELEAQAATLVLSDQEEARQLFGPSDRTLRLVRERFGVEVIHRDEALHVQGPPADRSAALVVLEQLLAEVRAGRPPSLEDAEALVDDVRPPAPGQTGAHSSGVGSSSGSVSGRLPRSGASSELRLEGIRLRTDGQRHYVSSIQSHDITFAIGPAGTGKTFLAVLTAVHALKAGEVQRIVLCRPAVEAGEKLGYLPGDFQAKVNPYMRPLYDALYALLDYDTVKKYLEREVIEVAPLAYMRGRTLERAFIILDEAQNTTRAQMKMFLTRMGERSKIVVTGDVTQVDLPPGVTSGLVHAQSILRDVEGIAIVHLDQADIVRHQVVWRIISAYEGGDPRASRPPAGKQGRPRRGGRG